MPSGVFQCRPKPSNIFQYLSMTGSSFCFKDGLFRRRLRCLPVSTVRLPCGIWCAFSAHGEQSSTLHQLRERRKVNPFHFAAPPAFDARCFTCLSKQLAWPANFSNVKIAGFFPNPRKQIICFLSWKSFPKICLEMVRKQPNRRIVAKIWLTKPIGLFEQTEQISLFSLWDWQRILARIERSVSALWRSPFSRSLRF